MRLLFLSILAFALSSAPPSALASEPPTKDLKALAFGKQPARAKALFEANRPTGQMLGAEWLEAMSWVARAGAISADWDLAAEFSERTLEGCERLLERSPLGTEPNSPIAIATGAAIETRAKFYAAMDDRGQAVSFLRDQLRKYAGSAIETRLNKNLLLLDLAGKPMPALDTSQWLGEQRFDATSLQGNVTLVFFWAHWCNDCAAQEPVLTELQRRFRNQGLRLVAPTQLYGYVEGGRDVDPAAERAYIANTHVAKNPLLRSLPVPLSAQNFVDFGVSTTPTLVLVDRGGIVRLYNPGFMAEDDLVQRIEALL